MFNRIESRLILKMPKRKCVFNENLQNKYPFIKKHTSSSYVSCLKCGINFSVAHGGASDIEQHVKSEKHKKADVAAAMSSSVANFFKKSDAPTSKDLDIAAAEGAWAFHTVQENHSFRSNDCASKLIQQCFEKKFSCARTKSEAIVVNVLARKAMDYIKSELGKSHCITLLTDASNHGNKKIFPILVRYFLPYEGIKVKILDLQDQPGPGFCIYVMYKTFYSFKIGAKGLLKAGSITKWTMEENSSKHNKLYAPSTIEEHSSAQVDPEARSCGGHESDTGSEDVHKRRKLIKKRTERRRGGRNDERRSEDEVCCSNYSSDDRSCHEMKKVVLRKRRPHRSNHRPSQELPETSTQVKPRKRHSQTDRSQDNSSMNEMSDYGCCCQSPACYERYCCQPVHTVTRKKRRNDSRPRSSQASIEEPQFFIFTARESPIMTSGITSWGSHDGSSYKLSNDTTLQTSNDGNRSCNSSQYNFQSSEDSHCRCNLRQNLSENSEDQHPIQNLSENSEQQDQIFRYPSEYSMNQHQSQDQFDNSVDQNQSRYPSEYSMNQHQSQNQFDNSVDQDQSQCLAENSEDEDQSKHLRKNSRDQDQSQFLSGNTKRQTFSSSNLGPQTSYANRRNYSSCCKSCCKRNYEKKERKDASTSTMSTEVQMNLGTNDNESNRRNYSCSCGKGNFEKKETQGASSSNMSTEAETNLRSNDCERSNKPVDLHPIVNLRIPSHIKRVVLKFPEPRKKSEP